MLSNTSKYATRALVFLALYSTPEKKAGIKKIAEDLDIPTPFLRKILQLLAKSDLLGSTKGPNGGFYLKRPAIDITLFDVMEAVDGENCLGGCVIKSNLCDGRTPCSIHRKLDQVKKEMKSMYTSETIADLVSNYREKRENLRI